MTTSHWYDPVAGQQIFGAELPSYDTLVSCVRCARCLPVCPTYRETLNEVQSPRGRLALIRAVEDGRIALDASGLEAHLYHCLDCRACNTVCPAGIPIGETILAARAAIAAKRPRPAVQRWLLDFFFAKHARLEAVFGLARLVQALRLDAIARRLPLPPSLRAMLAMLPARMAIPLRPRLSSAPRREAAAGDKAPRVGFFVNCVMNVAYAETSARSLRLLERLDCEVVTPVNLGCCGAPQEDQGSKATARDFARRLIAEFERHGALDVILTDSAGCGTIMKEYGHLLRDDPRWSTRAAQFSAKVRDINEYIVERVKAQPPRGRVHGRVTYHDPCHLVNTQKVKQPPRDILRAIPGLEYVELPDGAWCCGSAGIYNITHPAMADQVLARKLDAIAASGADILVTANPGCMMQIQMGLRARGLPVRVMHIVDVLDIAYQTTGGSRTAPTYGRNS
ncbi:MAG: (Fe-S)-binding protein [Chloroflexi bacterium]|nr:(Fe-S)-binding protein [Chloroflexota bacterium]